MNDRFFGTGRQDQKEEADLSLLVARGAGGDANSPSWIARCEKWGPIWGFASPRLKNGGGFDGIARHDVGF